MTTLKEGDFVTVTDIITFPCKPVFNGQVAFISDDLVISGMPQYGRERNYFVKLDVPLYKDILLQGWKIVCSISNKLERCVITSISKETDHLTVEMYNLDVGSRPYSIKYTITFDKIDCVLLYHKGYTLTKV
jgi:hypothetical protein